MNRITRFGPSLVLLAAVLSALAVGPWAVRELAYAQESAELEAAAERLRNSPLAQMNEAFRTVAERVEPSVVYISVSRKVDQSRADGTPRNMEDLEEYFRRRFGLPLPPNAEPQPDQAPRGDEDLDEYSPLRPYGSGSGWVYDREGHIVTNYHVVAEADQIEVRFQDGDTRVAEMVGADEKTDIAVLKVDGDRLHPAELSDRTAARGDIVFAFGSPFGERFSFSMTQGIVSGKGRQLGLIGYERFIQTDAAINKGNSGGPLVNIYGEVVGMNSAIASATGGFQGVGLAIPADMISKYVPRLIDEGAITRGFLGIQFDDRQRVLETFGMDRGVVITEVLPEGNAGEAGLQRGDVIVAVEGQPIEDGSQLREMIADLPPGREIDVTVRRNGSPADPGEEMTFTVELAEFPDDTALAGGVPPETDGEPDADVEMEALRNLGLTELTAMTRRRAENLNMAYRPGVLIEDVRRGSVAAVEGLRPGMVITEVQGREVTTVEELADQLARHDLQQGVRLSVAVLVRGEWQNQFVVLTLPGE